MRPNKLFAAMLVGASIAALSAKAQAKKEKGKFGGTAVAGGKFETVIEGGVGYKEGTKATVSWEIQEHPRGNFSYFFDIKAPGAKQGGPGSAGASGFADTVTDARAMLLEHLPSWIPRDVAESEIVV